MKTTVHSQRRNLRHVLAASFERKLMLSMKAMDLSVTDVARLMVKLHKDYHSWLNVKETILGILNGSASNETFCARIHTMLSRMTAENAHSLLGKFHQGYQEIPVGQSMKSRLDLFRTRKDLGSRLVVRKMREVLRG